MPPIWSVSALLQFIKGLLFTNFMELVKINKIKSLKKMYEKFLKYLLLFIIAVQITIWIAMTKFTLKSDNLEKTADLEELSYENGTASIKAQIGDFDKTKNRDSKWAEKANIFHSTAPPYEQSIIMVRHFLAGAGGYIALSYNVFGHTIEHPHSGRVTFPYYEVFEQLDDYQPWLRVFLLRTTEQTKPQAWEQHLQGFELSGQYFIGLELLYFIVNLQKVKLLALFRDVGDAEYLRYAIYDNFIMGKATEGYRIKSLGLFEGNTENWLTAYLDKAYVAFNVSDVEKRQRYEDRCPMLALQGWWGGANMFWWVMLARP